MRVTALLVVVIAACATAPVRDTDAERIDTAMKPERGELPEGLPMGEADALAPPDESDGSGGMPRGRLYRHLTRGQSDYYNGNVSVPSVTVGGPATPAGSTVPMPVPPAP